MIEEGTEGFIKRLETGGVIDKLSEAIVHLYTTPKPPNEIFPFFLQLLKVEDKSDVWKILSENQELRKKIKALNATIAELESKVKK